jgi:hypothetical protein
MHALAASSVGSGHDLEPPQLTNRRNVNVLLDNVHKYGERMTILRARTILGV